MRHSGQISLCSLSLDSKTHKYTHTSSHIHACCSSFTRPHLADKRAKIHTHTFPEKFSISVDFTRGVRGCLFRCKVMRTIEKPFYVTCTEHIECQKAFFMFVSITLNLFVISCGASEFGCKHSLHINWNKTLIFMLFKRSTVRAQRFIISRIHCWARKKDWYFIGVHSCWHCLNKLMQFHIFNSVQSFFHFSLRACIDNSRSQITASSFSSASQRLSAGLRLLCGLVASHCVKKLISD